MQNPSRPEGHVRREVIDGQSQWRRNGAVVDHAALNVDVQHADRERAEPVPLASPAMSSTETE
jgi:hypothetical protein